ncbi:MAG: hypothetical protein L6Q33_10030 [Bacteriovoracaceae bacterium]|nr:hypothetical protein [Bacteriovoracaceae bacterium]
MDSLTLKDKVIKLSERPLYGVPFRIFLKFDQKLDGAITFFFKHYGKTKFMVAMSKKVQYLGIEKLWNKGPKAFIYFFLFYLIRDTILYILIPIWVAKVATP